MARLTIHERGEYLSDAVFAASDGVVTTFAVVAGSAGAGLDPNIVLILGFANLFADGFSMSAGNYLGVKSEIQYEETKGKDGSQEGSPLKHGFVTFFAFDIAGLIPLVPFLFHIQSPFIASTILVGFSLFLVGILRTIYTKRNVFQSGVETFTVGGFASFVAFTVGYLIRNFVLS